MMAQVVLKWLAWITIVGGVLGFPISYGALIAHHLGTHVSRYMVPFDIFSMVFGMLGAVTWGAGLLILIEIKNRIQADGTALKEF